MALPAPAHATATPDPRAFRDALARYATGVAFVTAAPDGQPAGLIVNSLTSVSLDPPLVSFSPARNSLTWTRMRGAGRFGVNVLGRWHKPFARRATPAGADRFADLDWEPGPSGVPLLTDALATLECGIVAEHPTGDHWIVVGRVDHLGISPDADPLIFYAGAFGALLPPSACGPEDTGALRASRHSASDASKACTVVWSAARGAASHPSSRGS
jgi:3-hydroxy-9,10-secoandrosta-1,3,5(10)-triene-9,17-dione monooxygenase reductase component